MLLVWNVNFILSFVNDKSIKCQYIIDKYMNYNNLIISCKLNI